MENFFKHALPVLLLLVIYLCFSFIAWELNPAHWMLFTTVPGRFIAIFFAFLYTKLVIDHYDEY